MKNNIKIEEYNLRCILKPYLEQYKKKCYPLPMEYKLIGRAWFTQHDQLIPTLPRILRKNKVGCPKLGKWWQYLPHFRLVSVSDVREQAVIAQVLWVRAQALFPALKNCNWSCHAHNFKLLIAVIGGFIGYVTRRKFQSNLRGGSKVPF